MKVHYLTLTKELDRVIEHAYNNNRTIEFIELTYGEWIEFDREMQSLRLFPAVGVTKCYYKDVEIRKKDYRI